MGDKKKNVKREKDASAGKSGGVSPKPAHSPAAKSGAGDSVVQKDSSGLKALVPAQHDAKGVEDGGKEEFVDCPDEIETSESQHNSEEKDTSGDKKSNEADSGIDVKKLVSELEMLRDKHEKTVEENERFKQETEKESAELKKELSQFCHHLKVLNNHQTSGENADGLANHLPAEDLRSASLREIISDCSKLIKTAMDERLKTEEKVRELNAKIAELSESNNSKLNEANRNVEEIVNKILASVTPHQGNLLEGSLTEKVSHIENSITFLVEKYNAFISESDNLRGCLHVVGSDLSMVDEIGTFVVAREKILELRKKEDDFHHNVRNLEDENRKLVEELEKQRLIIEKANAEIEHEKNRCANTKEKLSMAVTKGKGLVQQRDSLKQLLAEKTNELEKSSIELQEKSRALEAAEKTKEFLQEKEVILQKCGEILSEFVVETEEPTGIIDKLKWLADSFSLSKEETAKLKSEIDKTKEAANGEIAHLTLSISAEIQEKGYLQAELEDLRNKYEAVNNEIDCLKTSMSSVSEERSNLKLELENLREKYEGAVEKENRISLEKGNIVNMLVEASGLTNDVHPEHSDMNLIIESCLANIKENACGSKLSPEIPGIFQELLYVRDQEMSLYKMIVEEDTLDRVEVRRLSHELETKTKEINALKNEKNVIQENVEQLEDRCALLKEKLSMAVKKGKGLVQDRENLKGTLNEKNTEIDRLKSEIEQSLSRYSECQDKITKLSLDVERIPGLEADLVSANEHADKLEQFLSESNSMLQRVMESIEGIKTPNDVSFEEAVDKVKWVAGYICENERLKTEMEQELRKVKEETILLEDSLSVAENTRLCLLDEKKSLEASKARLEEELLKEKEVIEQLYQSKKALEDALALAEDNISRLMNEREIAEENRGLAEEQLQKLKEEFSKHITKLADAEKTILSLEDSLSKSQKEISLLVEENSKVQIGTADLDSEMKKIREEADSHASKLADAALKIKSLEDELLKAENKMKEIVQEKKSCEEEILGLNSKLEYCMEQLAETRGSMESRDVEFSAQFSRLQLLLKDETFSSLLESCFKRKFENLKNVDFLLNEMEDCFLEMNLKNSLAMEDHSSASTTLPSTPDVALKTMLNDEMNAFDSESIILHMEKILENLHQKDKTLANKFDTLSAHMDESIAALLRRLHITKGRIESVTKYTKSLEQQIKDMEVHKQRHEDDIVSMESERNKLMSTIDDLQNRVKETEVTCDGILKERDECKEKILKLEAGVQERENLCRGMTVEIDGYKETVVKLKEREAGLSTSLSNIHESGDPLLSASQVKSILDKINVVEVPDAASAIEDSNESADVRKLFYVIDSFIRTKQKLSALSLENEELQSTVDKQILEIELLRKQVEQHTYDNKRKVNSLSLENEELQSTVDKQILEIEFLRKQVEQHTDDNNKKVNTLSLENEELQSTVDKQILEIEFLRKQVEQHTDDNNKKVNTLSLENEELQSTIDKHILEIEFLKKQVEHVKALSLENEELQSTIDKQILEIEFLKKQVEQHTDNAKKDDEKMKKLLELELGLRNIAQKLGGSDLMDNPDVNGSWVGSDFMGDPKENGPIWILPVLDKLVMATLVESEGLKSKNEELGAKLLGTQRAVDDLSSKVKFLEDSRSASSEIEQERGTSSMASLSSQPEISEMQDMAKMTNIPLVPSAAHVRTLKKGSNDQLAINIDSESERLINNKKSEEEDKGHVFKSLITTGLVPRQGRTAADRLDGIWVSGSRALMKHPRGRLGLIAYWLILHVWLLASIL